MITHKSTCGLCKPTKKWKRNKTHLKSVFHHALINEELTGNMIKVYFKIAKFN